MFLLFIFRAFSKNLNSTTSYFKVDNSIVTIYNTLNTLVKLKLEEEQEDYLELSTKSFKKKRKLINKRLDSLRINNLLSNKRTEEEESLSTSSFDINSSNSNLSSSSSSCLSLSSSSSSSSNSNTTPRLDSSNKEVLENIKKINKSSDSLSLKIKHSLVELLTSLIKQKTNLDIFNSNINSFFTYISIRPKDFSFKDTLDISQDYSKFIYST